jgi:hypothetical protein
VVQIVRTRIHQIKGLQTKSMPYGILFALTGVPAGTLIKRLCSYAFGTAFYANNRLKYPNFRFLNFKNNPVHHLNPENPGSDDGLGRVGGVQHRHGFDGGSEMAVQERGDEAGEQVLVAGGGEHALEAPVHGELRVAAFGLPHGLLFGPRFCLCFFHF